MAFGFSSRKTPTVLEQLLEEINFQRTKEMRQLLKDDSGFVVLQGTTYWTDLFVRHFLFQEEQAIDCDDLLFFVRKKHVKGTSRYLPKFETEVDVFRKDSKKLPIGDPDIDWEETVYLNLIIHQFDYTLTLAICTRTSPKELQVLKRHSQKVYASPSRRKMDTKGEGEEITYPHICFMVDNFDEVFCDILVRDGEMVCVELVASDRCGTVQGVIFLGSIRYDALKKVYDARQSSLSTKVAQRMTFGLFSNSAATRCEFVRMKGPQGKGHAEMAVTRPKGSGVETPTSEPGFCATDMWDSDWDEDPEDFYIYRHQRRLSDPSANINTFSRGGWKARNDTGGGKKCRSENEGLDSMANGMSEIEAGDLRDEVRPAFFGRCCAKSGRGCCVSSTSWGDMSEVYQRDDDMANETPACLMNVTPKKENNKKGTNSKTEVRKFVEEIELKDMSKKREVLGKTDKKRINNTLENKSETILPSTMSTEKFDKGATSKKPQDKMVHSKYRRNEFELADDAISLNHEEFLDREKNLNDSIDFASIPIKIGKMSDLDANIITVRGKEELPCSEEIKTYSRTGNEFVKVIKVESLEEKKLMTSQSNTDKNNSRPKTIGLLLHDDAGEISLAEEINGNEGDDEDDDAMPKLASRRAIRAYCTLPRGRRWSSGYNLRHSPPKKTTPDGTNIYYWCDISKKDNNELDDGAYNPLWTMRGFTQSFHFWKENKRQQSAPLNAFLTYVTLPWWSIAKDILDHREDPILTF